MEGYMRVTLTIEVALGLIALTQVNLLSVS
jgi:hypothetical protein